MQVGVGLNLAGEHQHGCRPDDAGLRLGPLSKGEPQTKAGCKARAAARPQNGKPRKLASKARPRETAIQFNCIGSRWFVLRRASAGAVLLDKLRPRFRAGAESVLIKLLRSPALSPRKPAIQAHQGGGRSGGDNELHVDR